MADNKDNAGEYKVGYKKPPLHSRFQPGMSGFKGQRKKKLEAHTTIIARVRDEVVVVNGESMTKFELAIRQVVNQTIKSGKPSDLKKLLEILDKYGAISEFDQKAEAEASYRIVMEKIQTSLNRTFNRDPKDIEAKDKESIAEVKLVLDCSHCGPELRKRWARPAYKELAKRLSATKFHEQVKYVREGKFWGI